MKLSIVITAWNTLALLVDCITSLRDGVASLGYETIVVDNASTDGTREMIAHDHPDVRLILNDSNVGFARANNQGWRSSTARYVLFLNSDTLVPPGALTALVRFMDDNPDAGICGPRLARPDGRAQPFAYGADPTVRYLFARGWNRLLLRRALHDWETIVAQPVDWVSGAALLARREALERVGGFNENYFMYFEDDDLCLRVRRAGWRVLYYPGVTITHLGGASLAHSRTRTQWHDASLRYFYSRHYSPLARAALELLLPFYRRMTDADRN